MGFYLCVHDGAAYKLAALPGRDKLSQIPISFEFAMRANVVLFFETEEALKKTILKCRWEIIDLNDPKHREWRDSFHDG